MIGVFDSGFGGLSIFKEIKKRLPENSYVYLGDNARTPYGNRSPELVLKFTKEAVDFLFAQGCTLVILACFTASSQALRKIQQEYLPKKHKGKNVLGVLKPVVESAVKQKKNMNKGLGVIGTRGTINSHAFAYEINKLNPKIRIIEQAAPLLVPLIEEGWVKSSETKMIVRKYLKPLRENNIDFLVLGCTHYSLIQKLIAQIAGKSITTLDSGKIVAESLESYLIRHPEFQMEKGGNIRIFCTDFERRFSELGEKFYGEKLRVQKAEL